MLVLSLLFAFNARAFGATIEQIGGFTNHRLNDLMLVSFLQVSITGA
jgi:hypothetical protein